MSKSPTASVEATDDAQGGEAVYVYCVGEGDSLGSVFAAGRLPHAIEEASPLELVEAGGLAAVASAVPLADYGEEALSERMSVPEWTAVRAMLHERVVEFFSRRADVVPLRFGTIYLTRARVASMLEERRAELRSIIERLRGREEWGVNVYADRAKFREAVVNVSPALRDLSAQAAAASPGQGYLLRKKIESMRADEARNETRRVAREVEEGLARAAEGAARLRVHKDESGEHGDVAAKLAFLVARERFEEFRDAAERLARQFEPLGVRLELTGPWPAYNFSDKC
jgi:hypothetical protein